MTITERPTTFSYLKKHPLFIQLQAIDPDYCKDLKNKLSPDYKRAIYKQSLIKIHLRLIWHVSGGNRDCGWLLNIPRDILASPMALSFIIDNPEFREAAERGSMSLQDFLRLAQAGF